MSLQQLCVEIEARSHASANAIVKAAHQDAERIVAQATAQAKKSIEAAQEEAKEFSAAEGAERLAAARLEATRRLAEARDEAVRSSLSALWDYYRAMPRRAGYASKLRSWAKRAMDELGSSGSHLRCNQSDYRLLSSTGLKLSKAPIDCQGGVRAESKDGRIVVDYTLEAQFERKREDLLHRIHQQLFSSGDLSLDFEAGPKSKPSKRSKSVARARKRRSR